jgi:hypothetical protein
VQLIDTTSVQPSVKGKRKAYEGDQCRDDRNDKEHNSIKE